MQENKWYVFTPRWDDIEPTVTHVGRIVLDPPAGKHGFLVVKDGHLCFEDGTPVRFWGTNLCFEACFPTHSEAKILAKRLAKLGFNIVRFHHMDTSPAPRGLIDPNYDDSRHIHQGQLDKLDFFISQLKEQGIYADINLHVGRTFKKGDGLPDADEFNPYGKFITIFDRRLIELQKEYARDLLTHKNPYTDTKYVDEPAVAIIEITNENSLMWGWIAGLLNKRKRGKGVWRSIPEKHIAMLDEMWNKWLLERYGSRAALEEAWSGEGISLEPEEDPEKGTVRRITPEEVERYTEARVADTLRFYYELERNYFREMVNFIKKELGAKMLVIGTAAIPFLPSVLSQLEADIIDSHAYWDHPRFPRKPWDPHDFEIDNKSFVGNPPCIIRQLSLTSVLGRPFTVSEWNHCFPNEYEYEAPMVMAAYGSLQDWDGLFIFAFAHSRRFNINGIFSYFDVLHNPVKSVLMPICSLMFLRGDIKPAEKVVTLDYTVEELLGITKRLAKTRRIEGYFELKSLDPNIMLVHKFRLNIAKGETTFRKRINPPFVSDTGELIWYFKGEKDAYVVINAERVQAAIGFIANKEISLKNIKIKSRVNATIAVINLDKKPIRNGGRLLLVAVARQMNKGQTWRKDRKAITSWGQGPVLLEPVEAEIEIQFEKPIHEVEVFALDETGKRREPVDYKMKENRLILKIGIHSTPWYEIKAE
ncbi:MAG: cellulase family glycosylhydrolase [Thermoprotei archaeon]|nr:cellulase family glycosylhydrolase [Thermoprotei archaeon]